MKKMRLALALAATVVLVVIGQRGQTEQKVGRGQDAKVQNLNTERSEKESWFI